MAVPWPVPNEDTGIGPHDDPNCYDKPADPNAFADDLWGHGCRWYLAWLFDENKADFVNALRRKGIEVIARLGPAYMPRPMIDMGVVDAYVAAGVRWFVLGNEYNLHEEWTEDWKYLEKPVRHVADWFVRISGEIRAKGPWCLTPPPSLGGHMNHREWFTRFMYALREIAAEQGTSLRGLLWHCGIGLHCRTVGNPLEAGPDWYDCSAREWEWFESTLIAMLGETREQFLANPIPFANTEAFDEPNWLPKVGSNYDWNLWRDRNLAQMRWFDPDSPGYRYPLHVIANTFWVIHADRFSPWPQCGLYSNYPHFLQRGDYTTDLWRAMPAAINWIRGESTVPPMPPEPPAVRLRVYDAAGTKQSLEWAQQKYGVKLAQYTGQGKGWHVAVMRERTNCAAGVDMHFYQEGGSPMMGLPVSFCWPGGCDDTKRTEVDGKIGWGYSSDAWIWDPAVGGPHWVAVVSDSPSDDLRGLGMKAMTNHDHLDFQWSFGKLEGTEPQDPEEVILSLAEELLQAIPVNESWAYPAKAISQGFPIQVGGYGQTMINGIEYGYQTFTRSKQDRYIVVYSKQDDWQNIQVAEIVRD